MAKNEDKTLIDDELVDLVSLNKHLIEDTERKKNAFASDLETHGDKYLKEIEVKVKAKNKQKEKLVPYILKHKTFDEDELMSYSLEDIQYMYDEIKKENKPIFFKFINFLFGLE